jgi:hypothetical protein
MNRYIVVISRPLTQHIVLAVEAPNQWDAAEKAADMALEATTWVDDDCVIRKDNMDVISSELVG